MNALYYVLAIAILVSSTITWITGSQKQNFEFAVMVGVVAGTLANSWSFGNIALGLLPFSYMCIMVRIGVHQNKAAGADVPLFFTNRMQLISEVIQLYMYIIICSTLFYGVSLRYPVFYDYLQQQL